MATEMRKTGIDIVGDMVAWGAHFCLFYETKEDLLDTLISYCKTGLESDEYCMWIVAMPLTIEEARDALKDTVPNLDRYLAESRLEIVSARDWFLPGGTFDGKRLTGAWYEKLARVSARGYPGMRVTGDTTWLTRKDWRHFCDYEDGLNEVIGNQRLAVLCTYPLAACGAPQILDVVRTHQFVLARRHGSWDVVETAALKRAKAEIKGLNEELERRVVERTNQLMQAFEEIKDLKDQLYKENLALREEVDRTSMFEEIVGTSTALQAVLDRVAKVAPTDSTVLITGETGTGKELIARAVHKRSHRAGRAFVSVNCAALAPSLISSELFGHERGAFTGATQRRLGRFELADGGTIFLDEVGDLPPDTQIALLRVLQEREFERVGGARSVQVDVRVIAATNRDLKAAKDSGAFREDLFYRLNVFPIEVPPLRERKDDILMLLEYFVQRLASRAGKTIRSIDKKTLELLQSYEWPGNIRELQNLVERSVIVSSGDVFSVDESWLSKESQQPGPRIDISRPVEKESRGEREIIEAALAESRGRVAGPKGAAAKLRMSPSTLYSRIKALNIRKSEFKFD
jgi:transcriptional regulator with GAF, ATPase, and Fis domain